MQRELDKQKKEIKKVAAKDPVAARMLAKSYVQMTKTHGKLYMAKASPDAPRGPHPWPHPPIPCPGTDVDSGKPNRVADGTDEDGRCDAEEHGGPPPFSSRPPPRAVHPFSRLLWVSW